MASGVPVPRATGDTLRDWRAEMVQASMSMPVAEVVVVTCEARDIVVVVVSTAAGGLEEGVAYSGGGGTAL